MRLAPLALAEIEKLIRSPTTPPTTKLMACESILNRGFGRAPQSLTLTLDTKPRDIRTLSTDELMQLANGIVLEGVTVDTTASVAASGPFRRLNGKAPASDATTDAV